MKTVPLDNGNTVTVERIGAYDQARVLGIMGQMVGELHIEAFTDKDADYTKLLSETVQTLLVGYLDDLVHVLTITSSLTKEDLEKKGEDAVSIPELVDIVKAVIEVNQVKEVYEKLGNALGPLVEAGAAAMKNDQAPDSIPN